MIEENAPYVIAAIAVAGMLGMRIAINGSRLIPVYYRPVVNSALAALAVTGLMLAAVGEWAWTLHNAALVIAIDQLTEEDS